MRLLRTTLATTTAACLLTACGGSGNPEPAPLPTTSTPSPTASASPTPPAMPAAAREKTKAGAIAFARLFIATLNYSGSTGQTEPLRGLYIAPCTRCEALADGIDGTYDAGGSYVGGDWTPTRFQFYAIKNGVAFVDALVSYAEQTWKPSATEPAKRFAASRNNLKAFNIRWTEGHWRLSALDPNK